MNFVVPLMFVALMFGYVLVYQCWTRCVCFRRCVIPQRDFVFYPSFFTCFFFFFFGQFSFNIIAFSEYPHKYPANRKSYVSFQNNAIINKGPDMIKTSFKSI